MPDTRDDALSLTLPSLGSRTRARRRKIPKPPKSELVLLVLGCIIFGAYDAATGHWVAFGFMMYLLGVWWVEMLAAMLLRRKPWWMRGPREGLVFVGITVGLMLLSVIFG